MTDYRIKPALRLRVHATVLGAMLTAAAGGPAQAAPHACALVAEGAARLACYDRAFPPPPQTAASAKAAAETRFGLAQPPSTLDAAPDRVSARVRAVQRNSTGDRIFVLENGHRWRQVDAVNTAHVADGETVELERAALGGFRLVTTAGVGIRVRRLP